MRIERILVPTDFSENAQAALHVARDLARQLGARLTLLYVQDRSALRMAVQENLLGEAQTDEEIERKVAELIEARFAAILAGHDPSEVEVECRTMRGDTDTVIPAFAREVGADMIVVGRRGSGLVNKLRSAVVGSVTRSVIEKSPVPVLIVHLDQSAGSTPD